MLREDNILIPTTHMHRASPAGVDAAAKAMDYVRRHWKYAEAAANDAVPDPEQIFNRIQSHSLCISGMAFQDAWTVDLQRLQRCCIHVAAQDKLIPFCSYYLTDTQGRRLWETASLQS